MAICEQCGKEHEGNFGSGRFCCRSCSNKWVALHQSPEAKARKVEKGKKNLSSSRKGWKLTKEQNSYYASLGAKARSANLKKKREEWLLKVFSGELNPWSGGYSRFRRVLFEFGYKSHCCESCGNSTWLGQEIPLELHHKDGNRDNNTLENLQVLCPNCHSLTENYKWRKYNNSKSNLE